MLDSALPQEVAAQALVEPGDVQAEADGCTSPHPRRRGACAVQPACLLALAVHLVPNEEVVVLRLSQRADGLLRAAPDAHGQRGVYGRSDSTIRPGKE
eukprot:3506742-Pyramimonas_sp.AAC.1